MKSPKSELPFGIFPRRWRGFLFLMLALPGAVSATPFRPQSDAMVLERLPSGFKAPPRLPQKDDPTLAASLARVYIERSRLEADPRMLGYAQGLLMPWWDRPDAPPDILLLRATIKQARHQFDEALNDLDAVIAAKPGSAQAWLTRATVLRVQGRYADASAACTKLKGVADAFVEGLCRVSLRGLAGGLQDARNELGTMQADATRQPAGVQAWFYAEYAEVLERSGDTSGAESIYRKALAELPDDWGLRAAYADLLLDQSRFQEALNTTQGHERIDSLRLRELLATARLGLFHSDIENGIESAFEAARLRNEELHLREEARFALEVEADYPRALTLAQRNWQVQHEYWDARLLLACAAAAGQPKAAAPVVEWLRSSGYEDARLAPFLKLVGVP